MGNNTKVANDQLLFSQGMCFVIQPFDPIFNQRYADTFKQAIAKAGFEPYRIDEDPAVNIPIESIEQGIKNATACFAEITTDNPNVWYELGYAMALNKPICLICSSDRGPKFPFDVQHRSIIKYSTNSPSDFAALSRKITERLRALDLRQQRLQTIESLPAAGSMQGLSPHEVAVLAILVGSVTDATSKWQLIRDMDTLGFTSAATGVAVYALFRRTMITQSEYPDDNGEMHVGYMLSKEGVDWLLANENRLHLRNPRNSSNSDEPQFHPDDIPF